MELHILSHLFLSSRAFASDTHIGNPDIKQEEGTGDELLQNHSRHHHQTHKKLDFESKPFASGSLSFKLNLYASQCSFNCLKGIQISSFLVIWPRSSSVRNCKALFVFVFSSFLRILLISHLSLLKDLNYSFFLCKTTYANVHNQTRHSKAFILMIKLICHSPKILYYLLNN